eukprot:1599204-Pleurochrysis_carterae.AAC.1
MHVKAAERHTAGVATTVDYMLLRRFPFCDQNADAPDIASLPLQGIFFQVLSVGRIFFSNAVVGRAGSSIALHQPDFVSLSVRCSDIN